MNLRSFLQGSLGCHSLLRCVVVLLPGAGRRRSRCPGLAASVLVGREGKLSLRSLVARKGELVASLHGLRLYLRRVEGDSGARLRALCWRGLIVDQPLGQDLVQRLVDERPAGGDQALTPLPVSSYPAQGLPGLPVRLEALVNDLRDPSQWRSEVGPSDHQSVRYHEDGELARRRAGIAPAEAVRLSILSHIHGAGDGVDYDGSGGLGGDEKHRLVFYVLPQELDQLPDNLIQYQEFSR